MKCAMCGIEISYWSSYGNMFSLSKHHCKKCWYKVNGWNPEDDLALDELNELKIQRLEKRIKVLEKEE